MFKDECYELFDRVRRKSTMYIGYASPTHLMSFLSGYYLSVHDKGIKTDPCPFDGFHNWVANKFGYVESTSGWGHMIEDQRECKEEALYLFFELLDEFRGIKHPQIACITFNHEDKIDRSWRGYSRLKKIKGTFDELFKPSPKHVFVRKINLSSEWFQMVAVNEKNEVLFTWNADELEKVYQRAKEVFGIESDEWSLI